MVMKQERGIASLAGLTQDAKPGETGSIFEVDVRLLEAMISKFFCLQIVI